MNTNDSMKSSFTIIFLYMSYCAMLIEWKFDVIEREFYVNSWNSDSYVWKNFLHARKRRTKTQILVIFTKKFPWILFLCTLQCYSTVRKLAGNKQQQRCKNIEQKKNDLKNMKHKNKDYFQVHRIDSSSHYNRIILCRKMTIWEEKTCRITNAKPTSRTQNRRSCIVCVCFFIFEMFEPFFVCET